MIVERSDFFHFPLDAFQEEACQAIDAGQNVLVCAPTGAGKTVVAEWAMQVALAAGKRCFYTTPLKALSNQKFFDLCQRFGEDQVGLSTGDVSVRPSARLVVMTTEVYRNMLYAAGPDALRGKGLGEVASVILDECHYMNDTDRGTVWEESIVYSPPRIQLVGLSATVANAQEMCHWLEEIHGPTRLVSTDFRPVPLRHYYFRKDKLLTVFEKAQPSRLNPKLFRFKDERPPRGRRDRSRKDMLCDPAKLLARLQNQNMLPAIYFVFSRRGCESMMDLARGSVTLNGEEHDRLDAVVRSWAVNSPEILDHPHLDSLRRGLAVHHAGILPLWKSLVENLFSQGLLKVVFATETLAAGINMPARTTIISALSKYTGEGLRPLTGSEMLQMSGRAGRRGMDEVGNVVIGAHPKEPIEMVAALARAKPESLESHFLPSYGMVLNLLERREVAVVKELLDRSFGQFLHRRRQAGLGVDEDRLGEEFEPPCPGPRGDRPSYLKLVGRRGTLRAQLKAYEKPLSMAGKGDKKALLAARAEMEQELAEIKVARRASPCHGCSNYHDCGKLYEELGTADKPSYWEEFVALSNVLHERGFLEDDKPTAEGRLLAQLRATNVYAVGESLLGPVMDDIDTLRENGFAAVCCLLMGEPARRDPRFDPPAVSKEVRPLLTRILRLCEDIEDQQLDHGLERAVPQELAYCGVAEIWGSGFSWEATQEISGLSAGDLFRVLRRTYDLSRQVEYWDGAPQALRDLARATNLVLLRGPLEENVSFFESPEGDPHGPTESQLPETALPDLKPLAKPSGVQEDDQERPRRHRAPSGVGHRKKLRRRPSRPGKNR
ncbi:MAG: DEAD/DEAH box helicase [Vulcanimicrobiota bacterium]